MEHEKLVDDLGRVLESDDFQFSGRPFHFTFHTTWTNPCLSIPGLGLIGLPLSHRHAEEIKASEWTSYNKDIWTISADHITFENPRWEDAVRSVTSDIYAELGMDSSSNALEYRLDRLLLFGPGSKNQSTTVPLQFSVEQTSLSTPCQDAAVANMLISLPSKYNGGEIELSPYLRTEAFEFSSCLTATCFWAWYHNAPCNVQPVKSGHRLMLLYKIVTTSSVKPSVFPDMTSGVNALRSIFQKWHRREYREIPDFRYVFYHLKHEYSIDEIRENKIALKGEDAHKVTCLQSATIKTGYKICLACFRKCPSPFGISSTVNRVLHLFDFNNTRKDLGPHMRIQADSIIPSSNLKHEVPSESATEHESSMSDDECSEEAELQYGLFMYHEDDEEITLIGSQGLQNMCWHLENSLSSSSTTEKEAMMVQYITQTFKPQIWFKIKTSSSPDLEEVLTDYALKRETFAVWEDAVAMARYSLTRDNMDKFLRATELFGFDRVRKSLQRAIDYADNSPSVKVDFLCELRHACLYQIAGESLNTLVKWCEDNVDTLMARPLLRVFDDLDELIQVLRNVLRTFGMERLATIQLGTIEDMPTCMKFLCGHILPAVLPPDDEKVTKHLLTLCSDVVIHDLTDNDYDLWQKALSDRTEHLTGAANNKQVEIVASFLWTFMACMMCQQLERCEQLFSVALNSQGCAYTKVVRFYTPLINFFCTFMDKLGNAITSSNFFPKFIRTIIWDYLGAMLGARSINPRPPPRRIGRCFPCQCKHCIQLDTFMLQPHIRITRFKNLKQSEKNHIKSVAKKGRDLVTYTLPSYHQVEVTKLPHVLASARWEGRVAEANGFLNSIGTKEVIERIMGSDYGELQKAMKGEDTVKLRKWSLEEIEQRNLDLRRYEEELEVNSPLATESDS